MHDTVIAIVPGSQSRCRLRFQRVLNSIQQRSVGCQGVVLIDLDVHQRTYKQSWGSDLCPSIIVQMNTTGALATSDVIQVFGFMDLQLHVYVGIEKPTNRTKVIGRRIQQLGPKDHRM